MKSNDILKNIDYELLNGNIDNINIGNINYDSRKTKDGDMFFCIQGFETDGHKYAKSAYEKGAKVLVCEKDLDFKPNCTVIKVKDARKTLAIASSNFYGEPSKKLKLIGITGTNGKTTSTFMIKSILEHAGYKVGLIGTIANYIGNEKIVSHRTTPESLELHKLFKKMVDCNMDYCIMEVSSHSLSLDRVYGLEFEEGIFTNLTRDHLDFHKTFDNYYNAKLKLFQNSKTSIINIDDEYGSRIFNDINGNKITYSTINGDFIAENIKMNSLGLEFDLVIGEKREQIYIHIPGKYNVYNALGVSASCFNQGVSLKEIKEGMKNVVVPGRCELVSKKYDLPFQIIIDYAHTPDGLENILKTVREFTKGKVISVFGCGGDRDKTKRPIMGKIGCDISDIAIITSDNPRTEEPKDIISDIVTGIEKDNYMVIENRKEAIKKAIEIAKKDDVILIAGKGHETYQILKNETIHFDEREIIDDIIKNINKN